MPWRTIDVELRARTSGFGPQMDQAATSVAGVGRAVDQAQAKVAGGTRTMSRDLENIGSTLTRFVSLPLAGVGVAAVKFSSDLETTFSRIAGLTNIPVQALDQLRKSVLDLSHETARSPNELAQALYLAGSAGLNASQSLAVVTSAAKASAAGMGDTTTVVDLLTGVVNAYAGSNLTASKAADILTAAVREGKAEPTAFAGTLGRVLPIASQLGVSFDQVAGAVAVLTNRSIDADVATTGLRQALSDILNPSAGAEKQLKALGINSQQLRDTLRSQGLLAALQLLKTQIGGNEQALGNIVPDIRALTTVLALLGGNSADVAAVFNATANSTGSLNKAFDAFRETASFKVKQALVDNEAALIRLGDSILPLAADLLPRITDAIGGAVDMFERLPKPVQDVVVAVGGLAVLAGPVASLAGGLVRLRVLIAGPGGIGPGAVAAGAQVTFLGGSLIALGATVGVIGVVAIAMDQLGHSSEHAKDNVDKILKASGAGDDKKAQLKALQDQLSDLQKQSDKKGFFGLPKDFMVGVGPDTVKRTASTITELKSRISVLKTELSAENEMNKATASSLGGLANGFLDTGDAAKQFKDSLDEGLNAVLDSVHASRDYQDALAELHKVQREDPAAETARQQRDVASARDGLSSANERVADSEQKLRDAIAGTTAAEMQRLQVSRDDAVLAQQESRKGLADAETHLQRIRAAGRSPKAIAAAEDDVAKARVGVERADQNATDSQKALDDARPGSAAHAKAVADAERDLRGARRDAAEATDRLRQAEQNALTPAQNLADHQRKVAEALERTIKAAETDWGDKLAAGLITPQAAAAGLNAQLSALRGFVTDPVLQAALDKVLAAGAQAQSSTAIPHENVTAPGGGLRLVARGGAIAGAGRFLLGDEGTKPELLELAPGSRGRVYPYAQTVAMLRGGAGARPMAAGGWVGTPMAVGGGGGSTVHVVRVVERPSVHHVDIRANDTREAFRQYEAVRRREAISRSLSDAGANDWTRG